MSMFLESKQRLFLESKQKSLRDVKKSGSRRDHATVQKSASFRALRKSGSTSDLLVQKPSSSRSLLPKERYDSRTSRRDLLRQQKGSRKDLNRNGGSTRSLREGKEVSCTGPRRDLLKKQNSSSKTLTGSTRSLQSRSGSASSSPTNSNSNLNFSLDDRLFVPTNSSPKRRIGKKLTVDNMADGIFLVQPVDAHQGVNDNNDKGSRMSFAKRGEIEDLQGELGSNKSKDKKRSKAKKLGSSKHRRGSGVNNVERKAIPAGLCY